MKDKIILILVIGVLSILALIVLGDFYIAFEDNRSIDESIVHLLQVTITGLVAIVGVYFGSKNTEDRG